MRIFQFLLISSLLVIYSCKKENQEDNDLPTVETLSPTDMSSQGLYSRATLHGRVSDEGASAVTQRGLCWSLNPSPTVSDDFSENDFGSGDFSSDVLLLDIGKTYYVRAYAMNSEGTQYGNQISFDTPIEVGSHYEGGIVFHLNGNGGGLIVTNSDDVQKWGCPGTSIGTSEALGSGESNTQMIVNQCSGYNAASYWDQAITISGGYDDWYLPSLEEAQLAAEFLEDDNSYFSYFWTSSQVNANQAWKLDYNGNKVAEDKSENAMCHGIRKF